MLQVSAAFGKEVWPPGLLPNQAGSAVTLPVTTTFRPMWIDPASQSPILASKLGLPLQDIAATQAIAVSPSLPCQRPVLTAGTYRPFVFTASLPQPYGPSDPSQVYEMEIVPNAPFDVFPPYITTVPLSRWVCPTLTAPLRRRSR